MTDREINQFCKWLGIDLADDRYTITVKNGDCIKVNDNTKTCAKAPKKTNLAEMFGRKDGGIQTILANRKKKVFTVVWVDGTRTMITLQDGDTWDNEKALAMCYVKRLCDNKGAFNDIFTKVMPEKVKTIGGVVEAVATIEAETTAKVTKKRGEVNTLTKLAKSLDKN